MLCDLCGHSSENLREFSRVTKVGQTRKTIVTFHLCPVCRVINAVKPRAAENKSSPRVVAAIL